MTTGGSGPGGDPPRDGRAAGSNYNLDERLVTRCYHERWLPGGVSTRCSFGRSLCEGPEQPRHLEDSGGGKLTEIVYNPETLFQNAAPPVADWKIERHQQ